MLRLIAAMVVVLEAGVAVPGGHALASPPSAALRSVTRLRGLRIRTADGTELSADAHVPAPAFGDEQFPVVIFANSWALPEFEYLQDSLRLAARGYLVLEYETRGWPPSGGRIEAAGPHDLQDQDAVISYILAQAAWRPDHENVALAGISYGGGLALLGAALDERVKTAICMSGWANLERALLENSSPNFVWGTLLEASGHLIGRVDPVVDAAYMELLRGNETALREFAAPRSAETYADRLSARQVPLLLSNNMEDRLFKPQAMFDFFRSYTGPKKLILNQGIHLSAEISGVLDIDRNHVWAQVQLWLEHWLKCGSRPLDGVLVDMQLRDDESIREYFTVWPSARVASLTYAFGPRGMLAIHGSLTPVGGEARLPRGRAEEESITFSMRSGLNAGMPVVGIALQVFVSKPIISHLLFASRRHALWYYAPTPGMRLCGTPTLSLDMTASSSRWQLVAYLFSVNWMFEGTLISHGAVTCWNCTAGERLRRTIQLRTLCSDVHGGLGIGFSLFADMYVPASMDPGLKVTLHYSDALSLTLPVLLADSEDSASVVTDDAVGTLSDNSARTLSDDATGILSDDSPSARSDDPAASLLDDSMSAVLV